ncbi:MAG: pyridoxal phosphate-dependent aminotransferase [Actinomycetota bacterium]
MRYSDTIARLGAAGPDGWGLFKRARAMIADGHDIVEMAIGEPDVPTPDVIVEATVDALRRGRTVYASGAGEPALRTALADRYSARTGRPITPDQVLCFPGTQTALYTVIRAVAGPGDQVVIGDPMYATYAPVVTACGAEVVPVPLRSDRGFRLDAADLAERVTERTTAVLLNTPHNPTGAVLQGEDIDAIGAVAADNDLWVVSDEVYEELVFEGTTFCSPLARAATAERTVVLNSISKSHAAPGFRSGWCVGPAEFCLRALPLTEAVLFGNQPFIADATALAVAEPSPVADGMNRRFAARAARLAETLHARTDLRVSTPEAGMFAIVDVSASGLGGDAYAEGLLVDGGVAVMPGSSFGESLADWIRISLTRPDDVFDVGCERIVAHAGRLAGPAGG